VVRAFAARPLDVSRRWGPCSCNFEGLIYFSADSLKYRNANLHIFSFKSIGLVFTDEKWVHSGENGESRQEGQNKKKKRKEKKRKEKKRREYSIRRQTAAVSGVAVLKV